jgi:uncharacterized protein YndB with AHSA1/START domain
MLRAPEPVLMIIADISGYTSYLTGTEIDHAQNVLEDLLETVYSKLAPPFTMIKAEGDALFLFAPAGQISGSMLLDTIDATYFAFRRRLRDVSQATTCECDACVLIPRLDLKFVSHAGQAIRQSSFGSLDLVGPDVIVLHRLLKNHVVDEHGWHAYALLTDAAVKQVGLDCLRLGMVAHHEEYEDAGGVVGWVEDLEARWKAEEDRAAVRVKAGSETWRFEIDIAAPQITVWEWTTAPRKRVQWQVDVVRVDQETVDGRPGVGTTNHCVHGKDAVLEEVLDWRPFDTLTLRTETPVGPILTTFDFVASGAGGTHLRALCIADSRRGRLVAPLIRREMDARFAVGLTRLADLASAAAAGTGVTATPAPSLRPAAEQVAGLA